MGKRFWQLIWRVFVSITLIVLLLWSVEFTEVIEDFQQANPYFVISSFLIVLLTRLLMPYKWRSLICCCRPLSYGEALKVYTVSSFYGKFLPATTGADLVRTGLLRHAGFSLTEVLASVFLERLLGFVVALIVATCTLIAFTLIYQGRAGIQEIVLLTGMVFACFVLSALLLSPRRYQQLLEKLLLRKEEGSFRVVLVDFKRSLQLMRSMISRFFFLTVLEFALAVCGVLLCLYAFGMSTPVLPVLLILPLHFLFSRIPISLSGIGVYEVSLVYVLAKVGVPIETGFAVGILHHLLLVAAILPGAFVPLPAKYTFGGVVYDS